MTVSITIAGLGAGAPGQITLEVFEALRASPRNFFRTGQHPAARWLAENGIIYSTFDRYYDSSGSFKEVYERIADTVLAESKAAPLVYAVPGHPLVAEESVRLIISRAGKEGANVKILAGTSFLDALFVSLNLDPSSGITVVDALSLEEQVFSPQGGIIVSQLYSRLVASDVKLSLLESYPPGYPVTLVRAAGVPGEERIEKVCLEELDRLAWVDCLTSLYVPPSGVRKPETTGPESERDRVEVIQVYGEDNHGSQETGSFGREECAYPLDPLVGILARLRSENGCPWDREQTHSTLKRYLLEETYEVLEAITGGNMYKLCEELGDLLLQIVFHAQIAAENGHFDANGIIAGISEKLIRRHPHIYGTTTVKDSNDVRVKWEEIKARERKEEGVKKSFLAGVPMSLPALIRAARVQEKAAQAGFDWPDYHGALDKTKEEINELEAAVASGNQPAIENEAGDLLFSAVNLARLLGIEPEAALTGTTCKFLRRFAFVEQSARAAGRDILQCNLVELDAWWEEAKKREK
ncbi:MAG: bifunctional methyltransferase/pyrophosphohydrolase YabN [Eubacteriales bacterium]